MKKVNLIAFALLVSVSTFAQKWSLDKAHSQLGFTVTHLLISEVDGNIKNFDASITSTKPNFSDAVVELTGDLKSINTNMEMRDGHLQGEQWFNTEKFPSLFFKSTGIKANGANKYKLKGNLTIKGVTKPVTLDFVYKGSKKDERSGKMIAGFKVTGKVNRVAFGVGAAGGASVSEEIELRAGGEFMAN